MINQGINNLISENDQLYVESTNIVKLCYSRLHKEGEGMSLRDGEEEGQSCGVRKTKGNLKKLI